MSKKLTTYKGTDKDMKCHGGFQYELGKMYTDDGAIRCGGSGFHSCKTPLDVFRYFAPNKSRYFVCEAGGIVDEDNEDSKIASSELTLTAEIGIPGPMEPQPPGTMEPQPPGTVEPQPPGTAEPQPPGTVEPQPPGTMEPQPPGTAEPQPPGTAEPQHREGV